jgi:hypothetical protein
MNPVETPAAIFGLPSFQGGDVDLQRALDVLVESTDARCAFAVHLSQDTEKQMGILAGTTSDETGTSSLPKFGAYEIAHSEETVYQILKHNEWPRLPKAQTVDWVAA